LGVEVRPAPADLDGGVVLAGHHVGVGDDHAVAGDPAAALHAQPARGAEDLDHAAARGPHVRVARDARVGLGDVGLRALDLRERVEAGKRAQDRPGRRQVLVEVAEDCRALDRLTQVAGAGRLERHRAGDPDQPQPHAGHQRAAADAVEHAEPIAQAVAQPEPDQLEPGGQDAAEHERADEREQRRVGRFRALREQQRSQARTYEGTRGKAGQ
jgi:hypothetical protein